MIVKYTKNGVQHCIFDTAAHVMSDSSITTIKIGGEEVVTSIPYEEVCRMFNDGIDVCIPEESVIKNKNVIEWRNVLSKMSEASVNAIVRYHSDLFNAVCDGTLTPVQESALRTVVDEYGTMPDSGPTPKKGNLIMKFADWVKANGGTLSLIGWQVISDIVSKKQWAELYDIPDEQLQQIMDKKGMFLE